MDSVDHHLVGHLVGHLAGHHLVDHPVDHLAVVVPAGHLAVAVDRLVVAVVERRLPICLFGVLVADLVGLAGVAVVLAAVAGSSPQGLQEEQVVEPPLESR